MKKLFILVGLLGLLPLTGCGGDKYIDQVKAQSFGESQTLTNGQALDHWKLCEDVQWKTATTDQGQTIVEYHCTIANLDMWKAEKAKTNSPKINAELKANPLTRKEFMIRWTYDPSGQPILTYMGWGTFWTHGQSDWNTVGKSILCGNRAREGTLLAIAADNASDLTNFNKVAQAYYENLSDDCTN